jgi:spermidine synthase
MARLYRALGIAAALLFAGGVLLGFVQSLRATARPPALSLDPKDHLRDFVRRGDYERVLGELDAELRLETSPERRFDALVRKGRLLAYLGRRDEAVALYREALAIDPTRADARAWLLAALAASGRNADVIPEYREILARVPGDPVLHSNFAYALERVGDADGALLEYQRALELAPDLPQANFGLGRLLHVLGRSAEAVAPLERATSLRPELAGGYVWLANACRDAGRGDEAVASYRKALALEPRLYGLRMELSHLLIAIGRRDEAVAELRRALADRPDDPVVLNNLAWLLATGVEVAPAAADEAVALARRSSERESDAAALDTLGAALAAAGRFGEASRAARKALEQARAQGDTAVADAIAERLRGYAAKKRAIDVPAPAPSAEGRDS